MAIRISQADTRRPFSEFKVGELFFHGHRYWMKTDTEHAKAITETPMRSFVTKHFYEEGESMYVYDVWIERRI